MLTNQNTPYIHVIHLGTLLHKMGDAGDHFKFYWRGLNLSGCENVSSIVYKDTKNKQTGFRPNHSVSPPLSGSFFFSRLLFHCSSWATALNKSVMLQITVRCDLTWVWHVKERVCQLFEVFQHGFVHLSLPCEDRLSIFFFFCMFFNFIRLSYHKITNMQKQKQQ